MLWTRHFFEGFCSKWYANKFSQSDEFLDFTRNGTLYSNEEKKHISSNIEFLRKKNVLVNPYKLYSPFWYGYDVQRKKSKYPFRWAQNWKMTKCSLKFIRSKSVEWCINLIRSTQWAFEKAKIDLMSLAHLVQMQTAFAVKLPFKWIDSLAPCLGDIKKNSIYFACFNKTEKIYVCIEKNNINWLLIDIRNDCVRVHVLKRIRIRKVGELNGFFAWNVNQNICCLQCLYYSLSIIMAARCGFVVVFSIGKSYRAT